MTALLEWWARQTLLAPTWVRWSETVLFVHLLILSGGLAATLVPRVGPGLRHRVLLGTLVAALLLPLLRLGAAAPAPVQWVGEGPGSAGSVGWGTLVISVWAVGVLLLFVRLIRSHRRMADILRRSSDLTTGVWEIERKALGLSVRLACSDEVSSPLVAGWRRPTVLVPSTEVSTERAIARAVLLHERSHLGRRDVPTLTLALVARAVLWPCVPVWWLVSRMTLYAEMACDRAVVSGGVDRPTYVRQLLAFADRGAGLVGVPGFGQSEMTRRVRAICGTTTSLRPRQPQGSGEGLLGLAAPAAIVLLLLFVFTSAEVPTPSLGFVFADGADAVGTTDAAGMVEWPESLVVPDGERGH